MMTSDFYQQILESLPNGTVEQVCIGLHWTAVAVEVEGERRCGLASTLNSGHVHGETDIPEAGTLASRSIPRSCASFA